MKATRSVSPVLICGLAMGCSGPTSESGTAFTVGGNTYVVPSNGGALALGGTTARANSSLGGAVTTTGGLSPTTVGSTGGTTSSGGTNARSSGGNTVPSTGGATVDGTAGTIAKAIGGASSIATGGRTTGGSTTGTSGGATSAGGTKSTGGTSSATGGRTNGGGTTSTSGGTTAAGGALSSCGSATLNPNPFGCSFAWGLSDPAGSFSALSFLQFSTFWVDYGIAADGTFGSYLGVNWLKDKVASTNLIPVFYGYIVGYYAHANGIVDGNQCPASNPNCPNLTNNGAAFVKAHRSTIVQAYANYAKQSYAVWPTKPLVWLLEGDFVQFTDSAQTNPLTMTEVAQLAADITCAIKGNMPNAVVGINQSTWNANNVTDSYWAAMKSVGVKHDFAWTTGVATSNDFFNTGVSASTYNGATATYSYLHKVSGKKIFVDDGCGGNTKEDWAPASAATLNARILSGVMAFNHCADLEPNYQSQLAALKPQLNSTCQ